VRCRRRGYHGTQCGGGPVGATPRAGPRHVRRHTWAFARPRHPSVELFRGRPRPPGRIASGHPAGWRDAWGPLALPQCRLQRRLLFLGGVAGRAPLTPCGLGRQVATPPLPPAAPVHPPRTSAHPRPTPASGSPLLSPPVLPSAPPGLRIRSRAIAAARTPLCRPSPCASVPCGPRVWWARCGVRGHGAGARGRGRLWGPVPPEGPWGGPPSWRLLPLGPAPHPLLGVPRVRQCSGRGRRRCRWRCRHLAPPLLRGR
jgi:hypothetical protein